MHPTAISVGPSFALKVVSARRMPVALRHSLQLRGI